MGRTCTDSTVTIGRSLVVLRVTFGAACAHLSWSVYCGTFHGNHGGTSSKHTATYQHLIYVCLLVPSLSLPLRLLYRFSQSTKAKDEQKYWR